MDIGYVHGAATVNIGSAGLYLIKSFEQCRLKAFKPTPNDVWTIGWGHTNGVKEGDTCTQEEADSLLTLDLGWVEDCVNDVTEGPAIEWTLTGEKAVHHDSEGPHI